MGTRLVAKLASPHLSAQTTHYVGLPPELTGGQDYRQRIGPALLLLISATSEGVFLNRFDALGNGVGDTWHTSLEEAKEQAKFEFPAAPLQWLAVPPHEPDPVAFGLHYR
jgi:hypothetical protein